MGTCHGKPTYEELENDLEEMQNLVDMGVDGLISDYPNKFNALDY